MNAENVRSKSAERWRFILFIVVFACACLEGTSWYLLTRNPVISHPILNHMWRPNRSWQDTDGAWCRVNSAGWLHDGEVLRKKPSDVFRIFYLGDSFTAGMCEASVPYFVAKALEQKTAPDGRRYEVINAGTPSYSPSVFLLQLETFILEYSPDLVVINVDMSDVFDDYIASMIATRDSAQKIVALPFESSFMQTHFRIAQGLVPKSSVQQLVSRLATRSNFFYLLARVTAVDRFEYKAAEKSGADAYGWCRKEWSPMTQTQVETTKQMFRTILQRLKDVKIKVAATAVPHLEQFTGEYSERPLTEIRELCDEAGVPYLDSLAGLRAAFGEKEPRQFFIKNDMHYTKQTQEIWGKLHTAFLLDPANHLLTP